MLSRRRPAPRTTADGERGFSLLESTLAVALVVVGVSGLLDALLAVARLRALSEADARVAAAARSLLADLRAAAVYSPAGRFAVLDGTPVTVTLPLPGGTPLPIVCTPSIASGIATVACADPQGRTARAQGFVGESVPPPGSALPYAPPPVR